MYSLHHLHMISPYGDKITIDTALTKLIKRAVSSVGISRITKGMLLRDV